MLQTYGGSILGLDNTANTFGAVGNLTALRSLYEEYRIDAIKFTFIPLFTQSVNIATGNAAGQVSYAINRSPSAPAPSAFTDILRQNDCKVFNTNRGFAVTVRKPMWASYQTNGIAAGATAPGMFSGVASHAWCSCRDFAATQSQPNWYGVDLGIENAPATTPLYRLMTTYYVSFRSQN